MYCPQCNSNNVQISTVSDVKSRGGKVPIWYWICCLWCIDIVCFGAIYRGLKRSAAKTKTKIKTMCACQDCGYTFEIKN